ARVVRRERDALGGGRAAGEVAVAHAADRGLVVRERGGAAQRQGAGRVVVRADDAVLVGEEEVVAVLEVGDLHGDAVKRRVVGVGDAGKAVDDYRRRAGVVVRAPGRGRDR